jgi:uncharacterized protein (UPF0335 family)
MDLLKEIRERRAMPGPSLRGLVPEAVADAIDRIEIARRRRAEARLQERRIIEEAKAHGFTVAGIRRCLAARASGRPMTDQQLMHAYRGN